MSYDRKYKHKYDQERKHPCMDCGKLVMQKSKRCSKCNITYRNKTYKQFGASHHSWRGGRFVDKNGYIQIFMPTHPRANKSNGYVREHIVVWETANNKSLPKGWIIHHLNGISSDNRISNLAAMPNKSHKFVLQVKAKRIQELEALLKGQGQLL